MKKYSRKHICEAIAYWKKQLNAMNESNDNYNWFENDYLNALETTFNKIQPMLASIDTGYLKDYNYLVIFFALAQHLAKDPEYADFKDITNTALDASLTSDMPSIVY